MLNARSATAVRYVLVGVGVGLLSLVINARPGERILRVFEGKANTFEALGDKKIVGLSMREADLVGHRLDCFSAQARANEVFEGADRCELVADLEHTLCPGQAHARLCRQELFFSPR